MDGKKAAFPKTETKQAKPKKRSRTLGTTPLSQLFAYAEEMKEMATEYNLIPEDLLREHNLLIGTAKEKFLAEWGVQKQESSQTI